MTVPVATPPEVDAAYSVPDTDDYLTDGMRLVSVLTVHPGGVVEVEDCQTERCFVIDYVEYVRLWSKVSRRPHGVA
jgi:hypothetical protein